MDNGNNLLIIENRLVNDGCFVLGPYCLTYSCATKLNLKPLHWLVDKLKNKNINFLKKLITKGFPYNIKNSSKKFEKLPVELQDISLKKNELL